VLWRGPAAVSRRETAEDDIPELIEAEVLWFRDAAAVELCRGEETLARMEIERAPALAVRFPPREQLEHGQGVVSYRTESRSDRIAVAIRASLDGGATWSAIVSAKPEGEVDVSPLLANSGEECFLEVLATSGYHTAAQTSEQFRVRPRDREILAWSSAASGLVPLGQPVQLVAIAADGAAPASDLSWYSDLDGDLGEGARLTATLRRGRHRIEVRSRGPFQQPASLSSSSTEAM
jgi:hypothetical protein